MKHLSYRQFKNIFGDWGVTAWVKFNWLSNGLPDGTYNGITKVTINQLPSTARITSRQNAFYFPYSNPIAFGEDNSIYPYWLSNYETISANGIGNTDKTLISYSSSSNVTIRIKDIPVSIDAYNEYLKTHPLILYFYNRIEWQGFILTSQNVAMAGAGQFFATLGRNKEIRDVLGDYENIEPQASWNFGDRQICTNSSNDFVMIKDSRFTSKNDFASAMLPRAIVYKNI